MLNIAGLVLQEGDMVIVWSEVPNGIRDVTVLPSLEASNEYLNWLIKRRAHVHSLLTAREVVELLSPS